MAEWNFKEMAEEYGNEYLIDNYPDDAVMPMDYFDEYYANSSPTDIVWSVFNGYSWSPNKDGIEGFNPNDENLAFNAYANPVSISEYVIGEYLMEQIDEDEFKEWCVEQGYFEEDEEE